MNLKTLIDPNTRFLFLKNGPASYAYPIVHVEGDYVYFSIKPPIPENFDNGYIVAANNAGILMFNNPNIETLNQNLQKNLNQKLFRINFNQLDYMITNRRMNLRLEFKDFIPISFNIFGETMAAQLINISESGLRMCVDTPLKKNIICQLHIKIPTKDGEIKFQTNGVIIYNESEEQKKKYMIGLSFVTPDFHSKQQEEEYFKAKEYLRKFILNNESATP